MFDIEKRQYIISVGELKTIINNMSNDIQVCCCGVGGCYIHIDKDNKIISFDTDQLEFAYEV